MKKITKLTALLLAAVIPITAFSGCNKKDKDFMSATQILRKDAITSYSGTIEAKLKYHNDENAPEVKEDVINYDIFLNGTEDRTQDKSKLTIDYSVEKAPKVNLTDVIRVGSTAYINTKGLAVLFSSGDLEKEIDAAFPEYAQIKFRELRNPNKDKEREDINVTELANEFLNKFNGYLSACIEKSGAASYKKGVYSFTVNDKNLVKLIDEASVVYKSNKTDILKALTELETKCFTQEDSAGTSQFADNSILVQRVDRALEDWEKMSEEEKLSFVKLGNRLKLDLTVNVTPDKASSVVDFTVNVESDFLNCEIAGSITVKPEASAAIEAPSLYAPHADTMKFIAAQQAKEDEQYIRPATPEDLENLPDLPGIPKPNPES